LSSSSPPLCIRIDAEIGDRKFRTRNGDALGEDGGRPCFEQSQKRLPSMCLPQEKNFLARNGRATSSAGAFERKGGGPVNLRNKVGKNRLRHGSVQAAGKKKKEKGRLLVESEKKKKSANLDEIRVVDLLHHFEKGGLARPGGRRRKICSSSGEGNSCRSCTIARCAEEDRGRKVKWATLLKEKEPPFCPANSSARTRGER